MSLHRPIYERQGDREAERTVADAIRRSWRCSLEPTPTLAPVDFLARRDGKLVGLIEVKVRKNKIGAYQTYMIAASKLTTMLQLENMMGVPAILAVGWSDAIGWASPRSVADLTVGGRSDRNDRRDQELVAHIPTEKFRLIEAVRQG